MKRIAIIGAGPTGIYSFYSLLSSPQALHIHIFEAGKEAGVGMPFDGEHNHRLMLANIASIEIPPLGESYLDWLLAQDAAMLARYAVDKAALHDRQFLPRILLGQYFRDRFLVLKEEAEQRGHVVTVSEGCTITDICAEPKGIILSSEDGNSLPPFDFAIIATGHVWPDDSETPRNHFPSPWSGMLEAAIPAAPTAIMGTSLSALDAAMAVTAQHGVFQEEVDGQLRFILDPTSRDLSITLMSRSGILPEADFYCPIPFEPLTIATAERLAEESAAGEDGLLDRIFALVKEEIAFADPYWAVSIQLRDLTADTFSDAYFANRQRYDCFRWAAFNLEEVERNKRNQHTVPWRYAILRLHEPVQDILPHLSSEDRERFDAGLSRVFVDNYAAVPSESIRRLLALKQAGVLNVWALGQDYELRTGDDGTRISADGTTRHFTTFIDARGQKPLKIRDLPFPSLRRTLLAAGEELPDLASDYTLSAPPSVKGRIALAALPYLMHDKPFVQGITACAEIGAQVAKAISSPAASLRRRLSWHDN